MTNKAIEFQKEFKALMRKYKPEIEIEYDMYSGAVEEIQVTVDGFICAFKPLYKHSKWDLGDGLETL